MYSFTEIANKWDTPRSLYAYYTHIELEMGRLGVLSLQSGAIRNVSSNPYFKRMNTGKKEQALLD